VFLAGLAIFTVASMACGLAVNQEMLIVARFAQGTGGALTSAVILGMIVTMFPGPREQAQAIGVFAFVASAGAAVGLLAGGILTQVLNWHWIFFVNLPVGAVTAIAARPDHRPATAARACGPGADVPGALLITGAMMLAVLHRSSARPPSTAGWPPRRSAWAPGTLVLLAAVHRPAEDGAAPADAAAHLRLRNVTGSNLVQVLGTAGMFGMFFLGSLYLRQIMGYDPLQIGLAFLPVAVVMGVLSVRYTDRLVMRFGARTLLFPGLGLIAAGLGLFALAPAHGGSVPGARAPGHGADGHRRGPVLPRADDAGHVERHPAGRRAGLGPGQHHRPDRRRARPGRAGHRVGLPDQRADRAAPADRGRPDRGLPPGLLDRVRPGRRRRRGRRRAAAAAADRRGRAAAGPRTRPRHPSRLSQIDRPPERRRGTLGVRTG
jgi:MFS family permease